MSILRAQKIGRRLGIAFGSVLLIVLLLGLLGVHQKQKINGFVQELGHRWLPSVRTIGDINDAFNQARRFSLRYLLEVSGERDQLLVGRAEVVNTKIPELFAPMRRACPARRLVEG